MVTKKLSFSLVGVDGNAFALMGAFSKQARKEGWTKEEIDEVLTEARSGDYSHLVCTLSDYCDDDCEYDDDEDCDDDDDCDDEY